MLEYYSIEGDGVNQFNNIIDSLFRLDNTLTGKEYAAILDSVINKPYSINISYDILNINSEYLISLIDESFNSRSHIWNEKLDLETFCEYVLPYRVGTECIENWKEQYIKKFTSLIDSLNMCEVSDSIVGEFLMKYYKNQVAYELKFDRPQLKPSVYLNIKTGDCIDYSHFTVFLCRAFGLPSTYDFVPNWGNGMGAINGAYYYAQVKVISHLM